MTTYYPFIPSQKSAPQLIVTFDGNQYILSVPYGLFGQRYYVRVKDLTGNVIYNQALTESPVGTNIETLAWNDLTGFAEGMTSIVHGYPIASTVQLTINGCTPAIYNGTFRVFITGSQTFKYPLSVDVDPGAATGLGILTQDLNMNQPYFQSSLVFRNNQFEINP